MRLRSKLTPTQFWLLSFLGVNLILILLQIYKQSVFVKTAYAQQRLERERDTLRQQRARQIAALHTQQAYQQVQQFALTQLGMQPIKLTQIHKLEIADEA